MGFTPRDKAIPATVAILLFTLSLTSCGERAHTQAPDIQASVGDLEMRDIKLDTPVDGVYEIGSAAELKVAIVNTGNVDDRLTAITGPDFQTVALDGNPSSPPLDILLPRRETVIAGNTPTPTLTLTDIDTTLRTTDVLPITFTFDRAGEVTVDVVVSSPLRLTIDRYLREQGITND